MTASVPALTPTQAELFPLDDPYPSPARLSPAEVIIYQMLYEAAEAGAPCPVNLDLEDAAGFNSTSMGPKTLARLEAKGLIRVERSQKARRVQIVASGDWTEWPKWHRAEPTRIDRGTHSDTPAVSALVRLGITRDEAVEGVRTFKRLCRLSRDLEEALKRVERRKNGFLIGDK